MNLMDRFTGLYVPYLGSTHHAVQHNPLVKRRSEMNRFEWAEFCTKRAKHFLEIVESHGTIYVTDSTTDSVVDELAPGNSGEDLTSTVHVLHQGNFGFTEQAWPEAKMILCWLYLYIKNWGGTFALNDDGFSFSHHFSNTLGVHFSVKPEATPEEWEVNWTGQGDGHIHIAAKVLDRLIELRTGNELDAFSFPKLCHFEKSPPAFCEKKYSYASLATADLPPWGEILPKMTTQSLAACT